MPDAGGPVVRVPFGPRPSQEIRVEVAADMLWLLRERNPKLFGDLLRQAMIQGRDGDGDGHGGG